MIQFMPANYSITHVLIPNSSLFSFRHPWVKVIVMIVCRTRMDYVQSLLEEHNLHKVKVHNGGSTRHRSIYNGVRALTKGEILGTGLCKPINFHEVQGLFWLT